MKTSERCDLDQGVWELGARDGAVWIFPVRPDGAVNQYVDFLHVFEADQSYAAAGLKISADTDFSVWLNGSFIGCGQYCNYPDSKTYEYFPLEGMIRSGRNCLAVTVFYNGSDSSVYRRGEPGLVFQLECEGKVLASSGIETMCRVNPCYHSGPIAKVSGQLFYTFGYDARGDDAFYSDVYVPAASWAFPGHAECQLPEGRTRLSRRPVERLIYGPCAPAVLKAGGYFRRDRAEAALRHKGAIVEDTSAGLVMSDGRLISIAWQMQNDYLSSRSLFDVFKCAPGADLSQFNEGLNPASEESGDNDGVYLVVDLGREEAGNLFLDIETESGVCVDAGYGEHLEDLRVRTHIGGRNFAARYICREGRQSFTHRFQRWSGRYLQIHVHSKRFKLYCLSLQRCDYPLEDRGMIQFGERQLPVDIEEVSRRTLRLCMHEHYEDTPWREQALYANDARTQALCGYYAFGESRFPASSFDLLGRGLRQDGFLELTAPARPRVTIPSFTLVWMLAVRDHFLYSGDETLARAFLPQMVSMLDAFLSECKDGLLPLRRAPGIWHFYDWSAGMSGYTDEQLSSGLDADSPLNCFLILAIEAVLEVMQWLGCKAPETLEKGCNTLRQAAGERFWDSEEGAFRTHCQSDVFTELTQALAVLAGLGSDSCRDLVIRRMARNDSGLAEPGLSQSFYTYQACMMYHHLCGQRVLSDIESKWGFMLKSGATSFWETIAGAADFHNAGSLCHGWSAVPLYVYYHDILGVQPLEPGFRSFTIDPYCGNFSKCSGKVPVPGGVIAAAWDNKGGQPEVRCSAPSGCKLVGMPRLRGNITVIEDHSV